MPVSDIIDTGELARRTGTGVSTWAKRRLTGDTPPYLKLGRTVRYRWEDVLAWLEGRSRRSTSDAGAGAHPRASRHGP
jgi:predicted DNA-binding transcriptional regulator AlpA